jgi:hypothetical protein
MEEIAKFFDEDSVVDVGEVAAADLKERGLQMEGSKGAATIHVERKD